jgi:hypothetical protein
VGKESAYVVDIMQVYFQMGFHKPMGVIDDDDDDDDDEGGIYCGVGFVMKGGPIIWMV